MSEEFELVQEFAATLDESAEETLFQTPETDEDTVPDGSSEENNSLPKEDNEKVPAVPEMQDLLRMIWETLTEKDRKRAARHVLVILVIFLACQFVILFLQGSYFEFYRPRFNDKGMIGKTHFVQCENLAHSWNGTYFLYGYKVDVNQEQTDRINNRLLGAQRKLEIYGSKKTRLDENSLTYKYERTIDKFELLEVPQFNVTELYTYTSKFASFLGLGRFYIDHPFEVECKQLEKVHLKWMSILAREQDDKIKAIQEKLDKSNIV